MKNSNKYIILSHTIIPSQPALVLFDNRLFEQCLRCKTNITNLFVSRNVDVNTRTINILQCARFLEPITVHRFTMHTLKLDLDQTL